MIQVGGSFLDLVARQTRLRSRHESASVVRGHADRPITFFHSAVKLTPPHENHAARQVEPWLGRAELDGLVQVRQPRSASSWYR